MNKTFIFSKSKPLNENRIDRFLIYVPLDPPLAWFGLSTHMKKAYWIWKLAKIDLFWVKYVKTQKSTLKLQKSQIFKIDKLSNNISWVFEMSFGPHWMLRKQFGPIWMYSQRFYENEKNRFFSNFTWFLKPHRRLRPEISSRVF